MLSIWHDYVHMCIQIYLYIYICVYTYMAVTRNTVCCRPPLPPLLHTFVAGPLLQTLISGLCVEHCSLQQACRKEGLSQDPRILLQALSTRPPGPVTSPMFLRRCYMYEHMHIHLCPKTRANNPLLQRHGTRGLLHTLCRGLSRG